MYSEQFIGLIQTTEGFRPIQMKSVNLDRVGEANSASNQWMGFRIVYGRTAKGRVVEFVKAGRFIKRDLDLMKRIGVIECVCSLGWAPSRFQVPEGTVDVAITITMGQETENLLDRFAKALA